MGRKPTGQINCRSTVALSLTPKAGPVNLLSRGLAAAAAPLSHVAARPDSPIRNRVLNGVSMASCSISGASRGNCERSNRSGERLCSKCARFFDIMLFLI